MALGLLGCNIADAVVVAVASDCKQLTTLELSGCDNITDAAVVAVASGCSLLTTLGLRESKITEVAVLAVASECKHLTSLNLRGSQVLRSGGQAFSDFMDNSWTNYGGGLGLLVIED